MANILKISEAASIAMHAMVILAKKQDELVSVKDISASLNVSANHLSKVMQRLTKEGLVVSIKGFKGGFKLTKTPENITLLEIYETIDGKFNPSGCLLSNNPCATSVCIMGDLVRSVNSQVELYFKSKRLIDLVK